MLFVYIVAQCVGAFIGFGLLKAVTPASGWRAENSTVAGVCTTVPHKDVTTMQALAIEFLATSVLILVCCGVWDPRNRDCKDAVPLKFGLTITGLAIATVSIFYFY